jgi:glycogen(starch) synthase
MNIALLSYEYPPETGFGGIGTYTYYHARALVKLGHRVRVFAGSTRPGTFHSEHDGVQVTRLKREGWLHRLIEPARARRWYWFHNRVETAYTQYLAVRQGLQRERFDLIEAPECGADASAISILLETPLAIRFHSPARLIMDTYPTPTADRELTAFVEQVAISRASIRTACSQFVATAVNTVMGVAQPVHVIPNGIDLELFDRDDGIDVESSFGVPKDACAILFANRLEERKGIHLVGEIAGRLLSQYPHVHFVLAGRDLFGYAAKDLMPRIREQGFERRFHVLGGVDLASVRALVKRADIFLLPSLWENCPYSCLEAMAGRCAIVSSDCGGMPELIEHRHNGLLARSGFAASFADRLAELIEDDGARQRLGAAARATVEQRLRDVDIARRTVELYTRTPATEPITQPV